MPAIFSEPPGQPEPVYFTAYPANLLARISVAGKSCARPLINPPWRYEKARALSIR